MLQLVEYSHLVYLFLLLHVRPIQSLGCFKCLTTNFINDSCQDPFNPSENRFENDCQATIHGKNGFFPARYCVKITGIVVDIEKTLNRTLLKRRLFLRTCITENIMESSRSSDSTGNFRLKNFVNIDGEIRLQGTIALCSLDGCNGSFSWKSNQTKTERTLLFVLLIFLIIFQC